MLTREELAATVDVVEWRFLRAHLERGGLIVVARGLDLLEAGERVANDDAAAVAGWIDAGRLAKPSAGQIAEWDAAEENTFRMLIVRPYILIQEEGQTVH